MKKQEIILHTGGNLGDRFGNLHTARRLIEDQIGPITRASSIYQTQAWGVTDQPDFLNQALIVQTHYAPHRVLSKMLAIERQMGRIRTDKWTARLIDIDLLFYEDQVINTPDLIVPHPFLHLRNFVLAPLVEIAPDKWHPVLNETIETLYAHSPDSLEAFALQGQAVNQA